MAIKKAYFLFFEARLVFISLKQVFIKAPNFRHFYLKYDIWVGNNISSYIIGSILGQLTFNLCQ